MSDEIKPLTIKDALKEARAFIDGDSPDWRYAKQDMLKKIDAALSSPSAAGRSEMISTKQIADWRELRDVGMTSAVGEYTPNEFWTLLDEVERLQQENEHLKASTANKEQEGLGGRDLTRRAMQVFREHKGNPYESVEAAIKFALSALSKGANAGVTMIDLDHSAMDALRKATVESKWIPPEYYANDWLRDVEDFLRNGPSSIQDERDAVIEEVRAAVKAKHVSDGHVSYLTALNILDALKHSPSGRDITGVMMNVDDIKPGDYVHGRLHLPEPTHYTVREGSVWINWTVGLKGTQQNNLIHSIKFSDGSEFDAYNGWRKK